MKWENPGHELDHLKDIILEEDVQFYIWGAATHGRALYNSFKDELNIIGFIDINPEKQGKLIDDITIYNPTILDNYNPNIRVIISTLWIENVFSSLKEKGFIRDITCFEKNKFITLYSYFKYNKITQANLLYEITEKCTLKCKHCAAFKPYIKNPTDILIDNIIDDLQYYFNYIENLNLFTFSGGDVLLHKDFALILEKIGESYYKKKIDNFVILTNGIILPDNKIMKLLKKYNVMVHITDYTNVVNYQRFKELKNLFDEFGVVYELITHEYWVDIGYPQQNNGLSNEDEWIEHYTKCKKICPTLIENKLFSCAKSFFADRTGYCPMDSKDYLDLSILKEEEKIKILEFTYDYCEKGYLEICKKCNGGVGSNNKIIPVAEQL